MEINGNLKWLQYRTIFVLSKRLYYRFANEHAMLQNRNKSLFDGGNISTIPGVKRSHLINVKECKNL